MSTLPEALEALKQGKMIILVDDEDRENEGDLVLASEFATPEAINFMATHARGLICLSLGSERVDSLGLPMMTGQNRSPKQTAFTVSVEARFGVTTGISAADRARTIRVVSDPNTTMNDIVSPGHIFPLRAVPGGVLVRTGHTEGSVDLAKLAGLTPAAVICEIMNEDGTMARQPELKAFSKKHGIPVISIKDLVSYRMERETLVEFIAKSKLPSLYSKDGFEVYAFKSIIDGAEHLALVKTKAGAELKSPALVRVHSECLTGDALGSLRCDCGPQLQAALKQISDSDNGVLVYMRTHEGRGIGLSNKIKAYSLQDEGLDTLEANHKLGFKGDLRHYGIGAQILKYLGLTEIELLTNNPKKIIGLEGYGLKVVKQIPIETEVNEFNAGYLKTKKEKMGHTFK